MIVLVHTLETTGIDSYNTARSLFTSAPASRKQHHGYRTAGFYGMSQVFRDAAWFSSAILDAFERTGSLSPSLSRSRSVFLSIPLSLRFLGNKEGFGFGKELLLVML